MTDCPPSPHRMTGMRSLQHALSWRNTLSGWTRNTWYQWFSLLWLCRQEGQKSWRRKSSWARRKTLPKTCLRSLRSPLSAYWCPHRHFCKCTLETFWRCPRSTAHHRDKCLTSENHTYASISYDYACTWNHLMSYKSAPICDWFLCSRKPWATFCSDTGTKQDIQVQPGWCTLGYSGFARCARVWYTVYEACTTHIGHSSTPWDHQYHRKIPHRSTSYLSGMRIIGILSLWMITGISWAQAQRSIFQDKFWNGIDNTRLRQGNIAFSEIPGVIVAITNNLLSFVGYISLGAILIGSLMYVFGWVSEEMKSKGKEAIKVALIGAVVSWSGWLIVNFLIDNF